MQSPSPRLTRELLYGQPVSALNPLLPLGLGRIAARVPGAPCDFADTLLWEHTTFFYYAPFLPAEALDRMISGFKALGEVRGALVSHVGAKGDRKVPALLRYCPSCATSDIDLFGEPYWHTIHQAPGVLMCPLHKQPLFESSVELRQAAMRVLKVLGPDVMVDARPLDVSGNQPLFEHLAEEAQWLYQNARYVPRPESRSEAYRSILEQAGWVTHQDWVLEDGLENALRRHFSTKVLEALGVEDIHPSSWIKILLGPGRGTGPPIRQLLLLSFLGSSASALFTSQPNTLFGSEAPRPPFAGPPGPARTPLKAPCLNPICDEFDEGAGQPSQIGKLPFGTRVSCPTCGYTYERAFSGGSVVTFGEVILEELRKRVQDPDCTPKAIRRELGLRDGTLERALLEATGKSWYEISTGRTGQRAQKRITVARQWLLRQVTSKPDITREQLTSLSPSTYYRLMHEDQRWFEEHAPRPRTNSLNHDLIDLELAARVPAGFKRHGLGRDGVDRPNLYLVAHALGRTELRTAGTYAKYPKTLAAIRTMLGRPDWPRCRAKPRMATSGGEGV